MSGEKLEAPDVIPLFLDACPSFRPVWEEHRAYWGAEEAGGYNDAAEVARHIVDLAREGQFECFPSLFALIERLIATGTHEVQGLAIVGVLEGVQNIASNTEVEQDVILPWLGPQSRDAWGWLSEIWAGKTTLMEVVRAQRTRRSASGDQGR
jgi:hypothetical protein